MEVLDFLDGSFHIVVEYGILLLEYVGVILLLATAVQSVIGCFKKDMHVRLKLAQGIALALEFKLGGEVLRTTVVREQSELVTLGAIVLLRAAMTFLIHWEIKNEESRIDAVLPKQ